MFGVWYSPFRYCVIHSGSEGPPWPPMLCRRVSAAIVAFVLCAKCSLASYWLEFAAAENCGKLQIVRWAVSSSLRRAVHTSTQ